ncbi:MULTISPECIES: amino acid permease [Rhodococcus]|jgi:L-asparagine permease|uniref:Amino acid permease n=2 Tax=Rhodococcus TaxID=1827 RepID=A0ABV5XEB6_9NOCA|nr:amino acid permease [Rhodococcus sp. C-2]MDA3637679.1 amino acid permease [Rhodococcus sp. C-2]
MSSNPSSHEPHSVVQDDNAARALLEGDGDYKKDLKTRQIRMIAIGGAIGTGLFLGAGGRLATAGPALVFIYAVTGFFAFLMLRAMGELVLYRPTSGSFVSYAREFYGEKMAFVAGWMYWMLWAITSIVDVTAAAIYVHYWHFFTSVPQWVLALAALAIVLFVNLLSVKVFGELEFWFAIIKVFALVSFLVVGGIILAFRFPVDGGSTGFSLITDNGGWLPNGALPLVVVIVGVTFAYSGIELVGIAAGETKNPEKVMPRAINSVIARIVIFYVGAVLLLVLLLPYTAYSASESPFVTFFTRLGIPGAGNVMNFVVLTAALSSLNAGLYSTGRVLRSMAMGGKAPRFTAKISKSGVPTGGILLTACITLIGVGLNYVVPEHAFEIAINVSSLGTLTTWAVIVLCQLSLHRRALRGELTRPSFRMPGSPYTSWATLGFVFCVLVLMGLDYPVGTYTVASIPLVALLLALGWFAVRKNIVVLHTPEPVPVDKHP